MQAIIIIIILVFFLQISVHVLTNEDCVVQNKNVADVDDEKLVGEWISAPSRNFVAMATRVMQPHNIYAWFY